MAGEIGLVTLLLFDLDGQLVSRESRPRRRPVPPRTRNNRQSEVSWLHRG
jgi:hypothetical protein